MFISDDYTSQFIGYSHAPLDRKVRYVNRFIRDSFDGSKITSVPFDVKNNILHDCYFLLKGDWQEVRSLHSRLTDIKTLDPRELDAVKSETKTPEVVDKFLKILNSAREETLNDFDEFIRLARESRIRTGGAYLDWFYNGLPYLVNDIPDEDMDGESEQGQFRIRNFKSVVRRIEAMIELCEDDSFDKLQLKEDALRYVYQWESNYKAPAFS